jgi:hypothetical protein
VPRRSPRKSPPTSQYIGIFHAGIHPDAKRSKVAAITPRYIATVPGPARSSCPVWPNVARVITASVMVPMAPAIHRCCAAAGASNPGHSTAAPSASAPAGTKA